MPAQNAPDHVLVEVDAEGAEDLLRDLATAEIWVASFHLDHRLDQLPGRTLGSGTTSSSWSIEKVILSHH
jgi:hypothetical protein